MEWLNYHHLLYFYVLGREKRLAQAAKVLRLSPQAVLGQIRTLESYLGVALLEKRGRSLSLSEVGQRVHRIAADIYTLGQQVLNVVEGDDDGPVLPFRIGASDAVPKLLVIRLLERVWEAFPNLHVIVEEGPYERLVSEMQLGDYDAILVDGFVLSEGRASHLHNHTLSTSKLGFYARDAVAKKAKRNFPGCLRTLPLVLPTEDSMARRTLNAWFSRQKIDPTVLAETEDSALLKLLGSRIDAAFLAPLAIEQSIREQFGASVIGEVSGVKVEYAVVTLDGPGRRHPALDTVLGSLPLPNEHRQKTKRKQ